MCVRVWGGMRKLYGDTSPHTYMPLRLADFPLAFVHPSSEAEVLIRLTARQRGPRESPTFLLYGDTYMCM